jgi:hypothetical protein
MSTGSAAPPWAVKTDSVGDTLWTYVGSGWSRFFSAVATPDSGCVLAGRLSDGGKQGMGLLKLSRNGQREWLRIFSPAGMYTSYGYVTRATDGRGFFVNGTIDEDTSGAINDNYIVRTDSIGETLWTVRYRPEIPDYYGFWLGGGGVTADGGYAICGVAMTPLRHPCFVARLDSTGAHLWTRVLNDTTSPWPDHLLGRIQATPDGGFVVVGSQYVACTPGAILVRLDSLGDTLWTRLFDGLTGTEDYGEWVVNTRDGGFAVSGIADYHPAYLIKTDSMGLVYSAVSEGAPALLIDDMLTAEPSPFRRVVNIRCGETALHDPPQLSVYDAAGRMVRKLPSAWSTTWDGRGGNGQLLPAGTYFIEARVGAQRRVARVLLAR